MTVRRLYVAGHMIEVSRQATNRVELLDERFGRDYAVGAVIDVVARGALASDARVEQRNGVGTWEVKGDPTEGALVVVAAKAGLNKPALDAQFRAFPKSLSPPRRSE